MNTSGSGFAFCTSQSMQRPWDSFSFLLPSLSAGNASSPTVPVAPSADAVSAPRDHTITPLGSGNLSGGPCGTPSVAVRSCEGPTENVGTRRQSADGSSSPYCTSSSSSSSPVTTPSNSPKASAFTAPSQPVKRFRRGFIRETTSTVSAAAMAAVFGSSHGSLYTSASMSDILAPRGSPFQEQQRQPQMRNRRRSRMAYLRRIRSPQYRDQLNGDKAWSDPETPDRNFVVPVNNLMDARAVEAAAELALASAALERKGRRAEATEAYLQAVDKLLRAFPVSADVDRKEALEKTLHEYMRSAKMGLPGNCDRLRRGESYTTDPTKRHAGGAADTVINLAVKAAICVKQSPIPDLVGAVARYTVRKARQVDERFGVQEKAWRVGRMAVTRGIELDREYEVHQKLADVAFVAAAAVLKAGIAYSEAKPYRELKAAYDEYQARIVDGANAASDAHTSSQDQPW